MGSRTKTVVAAWGLVLGMAAAGCAGSAPTAAPPSAAPTAAAAAPSAEPSAEASTAASAGATTASGPVSAGLRQIDAIAQQIVATIADTAKASALAAQIEPIWSPIEDQVKANSADAYTSFEDAFSVLEDAAKSGDAPAATKGAKAVSDTVASYTARYPG
jgi:hypothetical protein